LMFLDIMIKLQHDYFVPEILIKITKIRQNSEF